MRQTAILWQFTPRKCPVFEGLRTSFVGCNASSCHFNTNFFHGFLAVFGWKLYELRGKWRDNCNDWSWTVIESGDERRWRRWKSVNVKCGGFSCFPARGNKSRRKARFTSLVRENNFPSQRKLFSQSGKNIFPVRKKVFPSQRKSFS